MIFTIAAMLAQLGSQGPKSELPSPPKEVQFQILDRGLPKGASNVVLASPNCKAILVRNASRYYVLRNDSVELIPYIKADLLFAVAIADDGSVLMNAQTIHYPDPVPDHMRGILFRGGRLQWFVADPENPGRGGIEFFAFTPEGGILAGIRNTARVTNGRGEQVLLRQAPGDSSFSTSVLFISGLYFYTRLCAVTTAGYLCELPRVTWSVGYGIHDHTETDTVGVAFLVGDEAHWFETPPGTTQSGISTWTPDALTVAGYYIKNSARYPVIWREGKIFSLLKVGKGPSNVWFTGIDALGDIAVGNTARDGIPGSKSLAVIWREKEGLQTLADYLAERKIDIPAGWKLIDATSVSLDGCVIVGTAYNEDKRILPFRLRIRSETESQTTQPKPTVIKEGMRER